MPRQPRLVVPDLPVHVVQRGNNRGMCFHEPADYRVYLALLLQGCRKAQCAIHAYCLMGNHVHLLLTPGGTDSCTVFMHGVAQRYAYYYNRKYDRTGRLWEGRFRSSIVESSAYALACYRYIELNPVRAGMVDRPGAYEWSSYSANTDERTDPLVTRHPELSTLGAKAYAKFVEDGIDSRSIVAIREALNGGYPLATESFKVALTAATGKKTIRGRPGRPSREKSVAVPD